MNIELADILARRLAQPLPGPALIGRFEPRPTHGREYDSAPPGARQAAVLILLYPHKDCWHIPLTLRPGHLPDHANQVSLPGGAMEPGEASDRAALREFEEELGPQGLEIRLLGPLSPTYVQASNFWVEPWVAAGDRQPLWNPNVDEVEQLLEVPLAHLLDPANLGSHQRCYQGLPYTAPHIDWQGCRVWGATCRILGELITVLEELGVQV